MDGRNLLSRVVDWENIPTYPDLYDPPGILWDPFYEKAVVSTPSHSAIPPPPATPSHEDKINNSVELEIGYIQTTTGCTRDDAIILLVESVKHNAVDLINFNKQ